MTTALRLHALHPTKKHGPLGPSTGLLTVRGPSHTGHANWAPGVPREVRIGFNSSRENFAGSFVDSAIECLKCTPNLETCHDWREAASGSYLCFPDPPSILVAHTFNSFAGMPYGFDSTTSRNPHSSQGR